MKYFYSLILIVFSIFLLSLSSEASTYKLTGFDTIRNISISEDERNAGIINFEEFLKLYYFNYLNDKTQKEKNTSMALLNSDLLKLKYSDNYSSERKPPVILHWAASDNALGVVKTLFKKVASIDEGIVGVDYIVTEPLYHPDYPYVRQRSYTIKFSKTDVATTWFRVPEKFKKTLGKYDRKYNTAINIEIVGWRFLEDPSGKKNNSGEKGKFGIRENFSGDFEDFENKYSTYPAVLKLVNYLAEKHKFSSLIDNYLPQNEINQKIRKEKGIIYLDGPLSQYIKGHGLIALEHDFLFGGRYRELRHDFVPEELLILYMDLKKFRTHLKNEFFVQKIEEQINNPENITSIELIGLKDKIKMVSNPQKREFLLFGLFFSGLKINSINELNKARLYLEYLEPKYREKLTGRLLEKLFVEVESFDENDYDYLKSLIGTINDLMLRKKLNQYLEEKFPNHSKKVHTS